MTHAAQARQVPPDMDVTIKLESGVIRVIAPVGREAHAVHMLKQAIVAIMREPRITQGGIIVPDSMGN